ncbi:hypothetical protein [Viridibacillus arvi]|nr:hypothetical protein [Viridibacillus sp. JNUCC-6]QOV11413.1 hypothetical protein JNUCC6_01050 [Viridibacillus sp. JNUCC-6]
MSLMLNIPGIIDSLKEASSSNVTVQNLADIISDWVAGEEMNEIANK